MDRSTGRNPVESVSTDGVSAPDLIDGRMPTIDFFPADPIKDMWPPLLRARVTLGVEEGA
jgi:hypothetical protein